MYCRMGWASMKMGSEADVNFQQKDSYPSYNF